MKTRYNPSLRNTVALAALLVLAATASGCGVGLPTQPDVDSGFATQRLTGTTASLDSGPPQEIVVGDDSNTGGGSGEVLPDGEIVVPSPSRYDDFKGAGNANGHQKNKWSTRN